MASSSESRRRRLDLLLLGAFFFIFCYWVPRISADTDASKLLGAINEYRTGVLNISSLAPNGGADCVAKKILSQFKDTPCSNSTGLDMIMGQEPQFPEYGTWASSCNVPLDNTKTGQILPNCVPVVTLASDLVGVAKENYTQSAGLYINDTKYISAGVAHSNNWFVVILATNASDGDYERTSHGHNSKASLTILVGQIIVSLLFIIPFRDALPIFYY